MYLEERGKIIQINVKPLVIGQRGIPKVSTPRARVELPGLVGDYNIHRTETGSSLDMAVLILTNDILQGLNKRGWPVQPGDLGENFTIGGVDYDFFKVGGKYDLGKEVTVQVKKQAHPCKNLAVLPYVGKPKLKEFMQLLLDHRGWYAKVLETGYANRYDDVRKRD